MLLLEVTNHYYANDPPITQPSILGLSFNDAPILDVSLFVGRTADLAFLQDALLPLPSANFPQRIAIISGLGGMGKTQLAIAFARQNKDSFTTIVWLDAKSEATLQQSISKFMSRFEPKSTGRDDSTQGRDGQQQLLEFKSWLSTTENKKWLLIFDNHDNPKITSNSHPDAYDVKQYFPHSAQGSILITTRNRRLKYGKTLELNKLDSGHSRQILLRRSGRTEVGEGWHSNRAG